MNTTELETLTTEEPVVDELSILKDRARLMGITFSNNIGVETLKEKIAQKLSGEADETSAQETETPVIAEINPLQGAVAKPVKRLTLRQHLHNEQMRLVRIRITNLDPKKKDLPGEIFTVANEHLGNIRKYIPYGEVTDDGYHVPYVIYKQLEARRFLHIRTFKDRRTGTTRVETSWAKEFALEVLPPLTEAELNQLATAQKAAGSVD